MNPEVGLRGPFSKRLSEASKNNKFWAAGVEGDGHGRIGVVPVSLVDYVKISGACRENL